MESADQSSPSQDEASLLADTYEWLRTEWGIEKSDLEDVWGENPTPEYRREFTEMNVYAMKLYVRSTLTLTTSKLPDLSRLVSDCLATL
jgi:hypothetical protein